MKLFGRTVRDSMRVKAVRAARAIYDNGEGTQEIDLEVVNEAGERLTLQIPPRLAGKLVVELQSAYEAMYPPLSSSSAMRAANWEGMN